MFILRVRAVDYWYGSRLLARFTWYQVHLLHTGIYTTAIHPKEHRAISSMRQSVCASQYARLKCDAQLGV